ncbi:MAG: YlbF family regulator [Eubacteriales bacterium]|jgi:cell fate (sporulation/competence/biofilm development) regulator YlbF (YheA/YmcA/DUF963 family)|nr:YlbF family regulator [Eubacteriales bacterium]
MSVIEKAKELGLMIAESDEYLKMKKAEENQKNDPDAQLLLAQYNTARTKLTARAQNPNITPEEMNQIRNEMEQEYAKIEQNPSIIAYINAISAFNDLMQGVNAAIMMHIAPEESSCGGGDCSGCSGCH